MKNTYILSFFLLVLIIIAISLYFVDIPAPAKILNENYTLEIEWDL